MKKILMRAWCNPLNNYTNENVIVNNKIGNNIGNLLFAHSVMRTLMVDNVVVDTVSTKYEFTEEDVIFINAEYSCLVLPLANAFRYSFRAELDNITKLVNKLKIPCIVIGVGMQALIDEPVNAAIKGQVIRFMNSILDKSAIVGIRGEYTGEYLKSLGFKEEIDYTVIGCPSMYMKGSHLDVKSGKDLNENTSICFNLKEGLNYSINEYIVKQSNQFRSKNYVPQDLDELEKLYKCDSGNLNKIGFTNIYSWMRYLSTKDFSFGTRIHGNLCAVLSGVPAFIYALDARVLELAKYHNIPYISEKDFSDKYSIFDYYEKADFEGIIRGHKQRFEHYLDFLNYNGLEHIYQVEQHNKINKFDEIFNKKEYAEPIISLLELSDFEKKRRDINYKNECEKKLSKRFIIDETYII